MSTAHSTPRVVLCRPSHPGNIGAAARAMKTMGFEDLALVEPRHFPHADATALAAGALDVLERARVHATLEEALADCVLAAGFSARRRDLSHAPRSLRDAAPELVADAAGGRIALVFGNETSGLSNDELARCQRFVSIPANPAYPSLNLAAAVQLASHELATAAAAWRPASKHRMALRVKKAVRTWGVWSSQPQRVMSVPTPLTMKIGHDVIASVAYCDGASRGTSTECHATAGVMSEPARKATMAKGT